MANSNGTLTNKIILGGEREYKKALDNIGRALKESKSEMRAVAAEAATMEDETQALTTQIEAASKVVDLQSERLGIMAGQLELIEGKYGQASIEAVRLRTSINNARAEMAKSSNELNALRARLDSAADAMDDADREAASLPNRFADLAGEADEAAQEVGGLSSALDKIKGSGVGSLALQLGGAAIGAGGLKSALSLGNEQITAWSQMAAYTGATGDMLESLKGDATAVYLTGVGESLTDVAQATADVHELTKTTGPGLQSMVQTGITLRDTFGIEVKGSAHAAGQMMNQFGIEGKEAYDLIVAGAQEGANKNGDLTDVISKYGTYFADAGKGSDEFIAALAAGDENGVESIESIGEAWKTFMEKLKTKDPEAMQALTDMGFAANDITTKIAAGGPAADLATQQIIAALASTEDPYERNKKGIALFGDQWTETNGTVLGCFTAMEGGMGEVEGAAKRLNETKTQDLDTALAQLSRKVEVLASPALLAGVNLLIGALDTAGTAIDYVASGKLQEALTPAQYVRQARAAGSSVGQAWGEGYAQELADRLEEPLTEVVIAPPAADLEPTYALYQEQIAAGNEALAAQTLAGIDEATAESARALASGQIVTIEQLFAAYEQAVAEGNTELAAQIQARIDEETARMRQEHNAQLQEAQSYGDALKIVYGIAQEDSEAAAKALADTYGISITDAYDLIAKGAGDGANASGDLCKAIEKYAPTFGNAGTSADGFIATLIKGTQDGKTGALEVGEAFAAMLGRITSGDEGAVQALSDLGVDAGEVAAALAQGGETARNAAQGVVGALAGVEDEQERNRAGAALFGESWETVRDDLLPVYGELETGLTGVEGSAAGLVEDVRALGEVADESSLEFLQQLYGLDPSQTISAVQTLMDAFGVSAQEAYGLIATAAEDGANRSGDLLTAIGAYAPTFGAAGTSADSFVRTLVKGTADSAASASQVGEAYAAMLSRIASGDEAAQQAIASLGGDAAAISSALIEGGTTGREAMDAVLEALSSIEDEQERNQTGAALFGESWETVRDTLLPVYGDLGGGIDGVKSSAQALADITYDNLRTMLKELYGLEPKNTEKAAKALEETFGVTGEEAYEAIAGSAESGTFTPQGALVLGDMLDTVERYDESFADAGISADAFMGALAEGAKENEVYAEDIALAWDNLMGNLRNGGTDEAAAALSELGIESADMTAALAEGGDAAREALNGMLTALGEVEDEGARSRLGQTLFNEDWRDLGEDLLPVFVKMTEKIAEVEPMAGQAAQAATQAILEETPQTLAAGEALGEGAAEGFTAEVQTLAETGEAAAEDAVQAIEEQDAQMEQAGKTLGQRAVRGFDDGTEGMYQSGAFGAQGAIEGALSRWDELYAAGASLGGAFRRGFNAEMQVRSPSRAAMEDMGYVVDGYVIQAERDQQRMSEASFALAQAFRGGFDETPAEGFGALTGANSGLSAQTLAQAMQGALTGMGIYWGTERVGELMEPSVSRATSARKMLTIRGQGAASRNY